MTEQRSLVKKLAEIRREINYVPKNGTIEGSSKSGKDFRFSVSKAEDVINLFGPRLAEKNIITFPKVTRTEFISGKTERDPCIAIVDIEYLIEDGDSGEQRDTKISGAGSDKGEKAIAKAITSAYKQMLLQLMQISPQDAGSDSQRTQQRQQATRTTQSTQLKGGIRDSQPASWTGVLFSVIDEVKRDGSDCFLRVNTKDLGELSCFRADLFDALKKTEMGVTVLKLKLNWKNGYANIVGVERMPQTTMK